MIYVHPRAEPFYWAGSSGQACLFIHGFTASPSEIYPLARQMHEQTGCTASGILLPGHGSHPRFLNRTTWRDWYGAVHSELSHLLETHEAVYAVGLSLGGLLALHAGSHVTGLQGIISINAPLFNRSPWLTRLAPLLQYLRPYYPKPLRSEAQTLKSRGRYAYRVYPVKALRSLLELRRMVMSELSGIETPLLVVQSLQDESVHPRSAVWIQEQAAPAAVDILYLSASGHVATMGGELEKIAARVRQFINTTDSVKRRSL